jgi:hypothetical protein
MSPTEFFRNHVWTYDDVFVAAAALIAAALGAVFQDALKSWIVNAIRAIWTGVASGFSSLLGLEVRRSFASRREAESHIAKDIARSPFVFAYLGRGNYLQREIMNRIDQGNRTRLLRVIVPSPQAREGEHPDWTAVNEQELADFDELYGDGHLKDQLERTISDLRGYAAKGILQFKTVNFPHFGRLIITERNAWFTPYHNRRSSADNKTVAFRSGRGAVVYDSYLRLFNLLWDNVPTSPDADEDGDEAR